MNRRPIFTGRSVHATYVPQELPEYAGNPMIEALPPIMGDDLEVIAALQNDVEHGDHCRAASSGLRRHMIRRLRQFWYPHPNALVLEEQLSTLIREGYVFRNPADLASWHDRHRTARERLAASVTDDSPQISDREQTSAHSVGMTVVGLSGVGKTTAIQRVLSTYPQRIVHDVSEGRHPVVDQLVWLMVTCPEDGGTPALCRAILAAFDQVMRTSWAAYFTERGSSAHAMRTQVVSLAHSHALGVLVIDEIQLLKSSRSSNARMIMGFLLALMNDLEVPVLLVGTPEASSVLNPVMQNARRFLGYPCVTMDRLSHSEEEFEFREFVEMLWDRPYLRGMKPFAQLGGQQAEILDTLYRCTAGVHDLVVKMFMFAQNFALRAGLEELTPAVFQHVYETDFPIVHGCLERLHSGVPVDQSEWALGLESLRRGRSPRAQSASTADPLEAFLTKGLHTDTAKPRGSKGGQRRSAPRKALTDEQMAAGLEDARTLLGGGALGNSLVGRSGDVLTY